MKNSLKLLLVSVTSGILQCHTPAQTPNPAGHQKWFLAGDVPSSSDFPPPCVLSPAGVVTFALPGQFWSSDGATPVSLMKSDVTSSTGGIIKSAQTAYNDYFRVNASGQVMFFGKTTSTNMGGLYLTSGGTTYRVIYDGEPAAGGGSYDQVALMYFNNPPSLSDNGNFAFVAATIGTGAPGSALYTGQLNAGAVLVSKAAGLGDPSPDGGIFTGFDPDFTGGLAVNNVGDIAFIADTSLGNNRVFFRTGGSLSYLSGNLSFCDTVMLNNNKQVLYGYDSKEFHLYSDTTKTTRKVVRFFDSSPIGGQFNLAYNPMLNDAGQVAFFGSLSPNGTDLPAADHAVFLWSPQGPGLKTVARTGPVAGGGILTNSGFSSIRPLLSNSGLVYFRGVISPNSRPRLFVGDGTTLVPLISYGDTLENDQVIDLDLGDQESLNASQGPFNAQGQLAYWAKLKTGNKQGIFLYTPTPSEQWRIRHLHSLTNAGITGDSGSYAGDGISNFLKYATGMDPTIPGIPPGTLTRQATHLLFTYRRSKAAAADGVIYQVEWTSTLGENSWSTNGVTETTTDQGENWEVTARIPLPPSGNRFAHLKVTR
jgi:hypothetical protein